MSTRRELLRFGMGAGALGAAGLAGLPVKAFAATLEPRRVALHNLHTGEALDAVYWENGAYVPDAVAALNKVLRDYRTGDVHFMEPGLYDILDAVSAKVGNRAPFQIISGYRSPKTNAMLHAKSDGVAEHSLHMDGKAMDIRLEGVALANVHKAALSLGRGGVGFYPTSNFVHVDVGRVRTWTGV
ncbi:MAG TPA: DUF882 domain-containing protein [Caulobacteraceae bacterium]|nr:DUF882 domain-containing protein [Caulobacteraceae bacterium]